VAIFTKRFLTVDQYEEWLEQASDRINVLSIDNAPYGKTIQEHSGPVTVRYQTDDQSLAPPRGVGAKVLQIVVIGAVFFAAFIYLISKLGAR
jgi:hypothetical protein